MPGQNAVISISISTFSATAVKWMDYLGKEEVLTNTDFNKVVLNM